MEITRLVDVIKDDVMEAFGNEENMSHNIEVIIVPAYNHLNDNYMNGPSEEYPSFYDINSKDDIVRFISDSGLGAPQIAALWQKYSYEKKCPIFTLAMNGEYDFFDVSEFKAVMEPLLREMIIMVMTHPNDCKAFADFYKVYVSPRMESLLVH